MTPGRADPLMGTVQPGLGGDQLVVTLPAGLHPGVNTVQLSQLAPGPVSPPAAPRVIAQSNAAAFVLRPTWLRSMYGSPPGQLAVVVSPPVGPKQQVSLLLNQLAGATPLAFALPAGLRRPKPTPSFSMSPASRPAQFRPGLPEVKAARFHPVPTWPESAWIRPRAGWRLTHPESSTARS